MKQDPNPNTVCGQCGIDQPKLLHNVRLRGNFRRLYTTCVLCLHPQCFCPACLGVYNGSPPNDAVICYKCYSSSHPHCIPSPPAGSIASSRPCPSCLNPNLLLLNVSRVENGSRVIDCNAARLLLATGKIASMSMSKVEAAAALEAERRAKEAAHTKKRAREALDHVVRLMGREKINVSVSVNNNTKGNVNNGVAVGPVVVEGNVVNKVDDSNEVSKAEDTYPKPDMILKDRPNQTTNGPPEDVRPHTAEDGHPLMCVRTNDVMPIDHYKYPIKYKAKYDFLNLRPYFLSLLSLSTNTYPQAGGWSQRVPPISAASLTVFCFAG
ncbi:putative chromatin regulator PHD family [Helianthus annuus]|nr:putative chromatin regulator PHD family [Helianthus annuus]